MNERIELFKMVLERNSIVRPFFNSIQRLRYSKINHCLDKVKQRVLEVRKNKDKLIAFTKKTIKRRRQLAKALKTKQYKNCDNCIRFVVINGKYYSPEMMQAEVTDWDVENILLGE